MFEFFVVTIVCFTFFSLGQAMVHGQVKKRDADEEYSKSTYWVWGIISLIALFTWPVLVYLVVFR